MAAHAKSASVASQKSERSAMTMARAVDARATARRPCGTSVLRQPWAFVVLVVVPEEWSLFVGRARERREPNESGLPGQRRAHELRDAEDRGRDREESGAVRERGEVPGRLVPLELEEADPEHRPGHEPRQRID